MVWRNGLVVRASASDRLVVRASASDRLVVRASAPDRLVVRASAPERSVVRASAHMLSLLLVLRWDLVFRMDWCSVGLVSFGLSSVSLCLTDPFPPPLCLSSFLPRGHPPAKSNGDHRRYHPPLACGSGRKLQGRAKASTSIFRNAARTNIMHGHTPPVSLVLRLDERRRRRSRVPASAMQQQQESTPAPLPFSVRETTVRRWDLDGDGSRWWHWCVTIAGGGDGDFRGGEPSVGQISSSGCLPLPPSGERTQRSSLLRSAQVVAWFGGVPSPVRASRMR
nr:TRIO and F-actin-binding protein-like isoform X2 [Ipomoea batatas]